MSWIQFGQHCRNPILIRSVLFPEPPLQLCILHSDHDRAGDDRKRRQRAADDQPRPEAPGQHFAEMPEIDRMANSRTDSCGDEALLLVSRVNFRQASELRPTEVGSSVFIN